MRTLRSSLSFSIQLSSIILHSVVKQLGLDVPRHISFSGNGSKIIRVLTVDPQILIDYTKRIFEKVLDRPYDKDLSFFGFEEDVNPKESTCKGGLIRSNSQNNQYEMIVLKSDGTGLATSTDTYENITEDSKKSIVKAVEDFFRFVLEDMNKSFNFDDKFGVSSSSLQIAREIAGKDLLTFLERGIRQRIDDTEADKMLEESFFFYPIKGVLQALSEEIYKNLK